MAQATPLRAGGPWRTSSLFVLSSDPEPSTTASLCVSEAAMADSISDVARRLAENAEAVCRYYLPNGRREGRYWLVGDVHNTPGRSLYVRLRGSACDDRAVGRWTDAAAVQHGDLLDLIAAARRLDGIGAALDEARRFLGLAPSTPAPPLPASGRSATREAFPRRTAMAAIPAGTAEAARRLFGMSTPIAGTLAGRYLLQRGISLTPDMTALRFHPRCWYRPDADESGGRPRHLAGADRRGHRQRRRGHRCAAHLARSRPAVAKRRLRCRGGRWVTCWATRFASGRPAT